MYARSLETAIEIDRRERVGSISTLKVVGHILSHLEKVCGNKCGTTVRDLPTAPLHFRSALYHPTNVTEIVTNMEGLCFQRNDKTNSYIIKNSKICHESATIG